MEKCVEQAERFLVIRDHNENELKTKLKDKGFTDEEIQKAIETLKANGELDEARYVYSFIRSNNRKHPEGKSVVMMRLLAKGTDKAIAKEITDEVYDSDYTLRMLSEALRKIRKKDNNIDTDKLKAKLIKLGFPMSCIYYCLKNDSNIEY